MLTLALLTPFFAFSQDSKFIYAICEDGHGYLQIFLNPTKVWESEKRLTDSYSDEQREVVEFITSQVSMCELMESTYEPCGDIDGKTRLEMEQVLNSLDPTILKYNDDFQAFIGRDCEW